jgi:hypothetical protein
VFIPSKLSNSPCVLDVTPFLSSLISYRQ